MTDIMYGLDHGFFSSDQQRALQAEYAENPKPSYRRRVELALEIGAKIHPVNSWFFYTLWTEVVIEGDKIPNVMQKSTADKMAQKNVGDFKCQRCSFSAKTKTPVLDHFRVKHLGMRIICRDCHYSWTNMNGFKRHSCYKEDPTHADYNIQQSYNGNVIQLFSREFNEGAGFIIRGQKLIIDEIMLENIDEIEAEKENATSFLDKLPTVDPIVNKPGCHGFWAFADFDMEEFLENRARNLRERFLL